MRARCHHLINSNRLTNTRLALAMHIKCRRWNMTRANRRIVWSIQFKSRCVAPRRPFAFSAFLFCLLLWIDKFDKAKGKQQNVGMSRHSCSSDERKETALQHFVCVVWTNYQKIIQIVFVVQSSPLVGHSPSAERRHTHTHSPDPNKWNKVQSCGIHTPMRQSWNLCYRLVHWQAEMQSEYLDENQFGPIRGNVISSYLWTMSHSDVGYVIIVICVWPDTDCQRPQSSFKFQSIFLLSIRPDHFQ